MSDLLNFLSGFGGGYVKGADLMSKRKQALQIANENAAIRKAQLQATQDHNDMQNLDSAFKQYNDTVKNADEAITGWDLPQDREAEAARQREKIAFAHDRLITAHKAPGVIRRGYQSPTNLLPEWVKNPSSKFVPGGMKLPDLNSWMTANNNLVDGGISADIALNHYVSAYSPYIANATNPAAVDEIMSRLPMAPAYDVIRGRVRTQLLGQINANALGRPTAASPGLSSAPAAGLPSTGSAGALLPNNGSFGGTGTTTAGRAIPTTIPTPGPTTGMGAPAPTGMGIGVPAPTGMGVPAPTGMGVPAPTGIGVPAPTGMGVPAPTGMGVPAPTGMGVPAPTGMGVPAPTGMGMGTASGGGMGTVSGQTGGMGMGMPAVPAPPPKKLTKEEQEKAAAEAVIKAVNNPAPIIGAQKNVDAQIVAADKANKGVLGDIGKISEQAITAGFNLPKTRKVWKADDFKTTADGVMIKVADRFKYAEEANKNEEAIFTQAKDTVKILQDLHAMRVVDAKLPGELDAQNINNISARILAITNESMLPFKVREQIAKTHTALVEAIYAVKEAESKIESRDVGNKVSLRTIALAELKQKVEDTIKPFQVLLEGEDKDIATNRQLLGQINEKLRNNETSRNIMAGNFTRMAFGQAGQEKLQAWQAAIGKFSGQSLLDPDDVDAEKAAYDALMAEPTIAAQDRSVIDAYRKTFTDDVTYRKQSDDYTENINNHMSKKGEMTNLLKKIYDVGAGISRFPGFVKQVKESEKAAADKAKNKK